jgi:hypothetical protein
MAQVVEPRLSNKQNNNKKKNSAIKQAGKVLDISCIQLPSLPICIP